MGSVKAEDSGIMGPGFFPYRLSQPGVSGRPEAAPAGLDLLLSLSHLVSIATIQVGGEERAE